MKVNGWIVAVVAVAAVVLLVTWAKFSDAVGNMLLPVLALFGVGGTALVRKVVRNAKKKADGLYSDADVLADINKRKRRNDKRSR